MTDVSDQRQPSDTATQLSSAKAVLEDCSSLQSRAAAASAEAKKSVTDAKKATEGLAKSIESIGDVIAQSSSFDAKWEAFKKMFDDLNKMAIQRIGGMVGASTGSKRPAEMISEERVAQVLSRASKVVVLTGAGISAESGIPTFRGADGFWTVGSQNYQPQELATWEKFNEMPEELWRWYQYRWGICRNAKPNAGHHALVELEKLLRSDLTIVTQNIDGLHLEAGTDREKLYEIHGRIDEMRCDERIEGSCCHGLNMSSQEEFEKVRATVVKTPVPAKLEKDERLPLCAVCGVRQRPKILWFDECYNEAMYGSRSVEKATEACDVLLIIGTQLTTGLPSSMLRTALGSGATIIKMDTIVDLSDERSGGMLHLQAKSGQALPRIVAELRKLQQEPELPPLAVLPSSDAAAKSAAVPAVKTKRDLSAVAQPLQGSPASCLRKNISASKVKPVASVLNSNSTAAGRRKSSPSPSAVKPPQNCSTAESKDGNLAKSCHGIFVYGTLRPDDDSGASWTKSFCEGMDSEAAFLPGASLYIDGSYPAVCLEKTRCSVRGVLLTPAIGTDMNEKMTEGDRIEGFPDLYDRTLATVHTARGHAVHAHVYHRTGRTDRANCVRLADGDWLSRKRA
jgi:NAD-dependent deacetylase